MSLHYLMRSSIGQCSWLKFWCESINCICLEPVMSDPLGSVETSGQFCKTNDPRLIFTACKRVQHSTVFLWKKPSQFFKRQQIQDLSPLSSLQGMKYLKKWPHKLQRYTPTKGNQEKKAKKWKKQKVKVISHQSKAIYKGINGHNHIYIGRNDKISNSGCGSYTYNSTLSL